MASSFLDFEGMYDPRRNFAVTNWSDEDITINWKDDAKTEKTPTGEIIVLDTGDNIYTLAAGEVRTYPMYLAYYLTKNLVDREMYKIANKELTGTKQREAAEFAVANAEKRKPFEDKTMQEVVAGKESPEVTALRVQFRKELIESGELKGSMSSELHLNADGSQPQTEFAGVPKNKGGRPKKVVA